MRTSELYRELVDRGVRVALGTPAIITSLNYHDAAAKRLRLSQYVRENCAKPLPFKKTVIVHYNGPIARRSTSNTVVDFSRRNVVTCGENVYARIGSEEDNFLIFLLQSRTGP